MRAIHFSKNVIYTKFISSFVSIKHRMVNFKPKNYNCIVSLLHVNRDGLRKENEPLHSPDIPSTLVNVINAEVFSTRETLEIPRFRTQAGFTSETNFLYLRTWELSTSHFSTRRGKRRWNKLNAGLTDNPIHSSPSINRMELYGKWRNPVFFNGP